MSNLEEGKKLIIMAEVTIKKSNSEKSVEWFWQSNPNPWSKSEPVKWSQYSDVQNLIIEEAFCNKKLKVELDGYDIDFEHNVQISKEDENKQRPVKRTMRKREDKHLREERFMINPIDSKRPFGGQYGWVSPLILEVRRHLGLRRNQLPSKDEQLVPILVEKAAQGITEEGKQIGKQREAEKLANMLREAKNQGIKKVWQRCVYLYSLESFLYKKINEMMQLIGDEEHENIWRSKFPTLGPFCLLLWDDPFDTKMKTKTTLYRGANLSEEQLATYEKMATNPKEYRSFQAFTSCSRNRKKVNKIGNTLFIMNILSAFIADISALSEYPDEEEELVIPGVCFNVQGVEFDKKAKKYLIYLRLRQRFNSK